MGLYSNVPTFRYISATGITVTYNNTIYTVQSFYTNKKYVYWESSNPTVLQASNTMPTHSLTSYLVLTNDNGIITEVPISDEKFSISYNGDSNESIKAKIHALYESNKGFGDRFIAIEQNVDGIKQIVGEMDGEDSTICEKISMLEQKSDQITIAVEENKKEYNDDKEANELRESFNSSIIKLNSLLGVFKSEISNYYKDDKISSEERVQIETQLELLENAKVDFDTYIDKMILIAEANNQSEDVSSLNNAKESFNNVHLNLKNNITNAIVDGVITNTEITIIIDSFGRYNTKLSEIKSMCDNIIILGLGGVITEELARIDVKSDEIKLAVSKVESDFKNDISVQKIELEKQINDVTNSLDLFKESVDTVFKDGIVDEIEMQILSERIANIDKEKLDIDSKYLSVYGDENLSDDVKQNLLEKYEEYNTDHNNLKDKINQIVSDNMVEEFEKLEIDTIFKKYSNSLSTLSVFINKAIENISFNIAKQELNKVKDELKVEIEDVKESISDVSDIIDGTFKDNVLDEVERKNIEQNLEILSREKLDIDSIYLSLHEDEYLYEDEKIELEQSYNDFISAYDEVIDTSNYILNKDTLISETDKINLEKAITEYKIKLNSFFTQSNIANERIANNRVNDLKEVFQQDLKDINDKVDNVLENIDSSILDGVLDEMDMKIIIDSLNDLQKEKMDIDERFAAIYENENLTDELKEEFLNLKLEFDSELENLILVINMMIEDETLTDEERESFNQARERYNNVTARLNGKFEEIVTFISAKIAEDVRNIITREIEDLSNIIVDLESTMNGAFLDGVLSESEKISIKQNLLVLSSEKCDIDKQYQAIIASEYLDGDMKVNYVNSYQDYVVSYNDLVNTINDILNKTTIIDSTDKDNLNNAFETHNVSLGNYTENAMKSLEYIAQKRAEAEGEKVDKKYAEIILDPETGIQSKVEHINTKINGDGGLEQRLQSAEEKITPEGITQIVQDTKLISDMQDALAENTENISRIDQKADSINLEVSKKVGQNSIISAINQTAESIRISASKINLNGYVTFSELGDYVTEDDLGEYGTTVIHGSRIKTDSISVNQLSSNNANPIIKLFPHKDAYGNDTYCSIDATQLYETGIGDAIRLKWDSMNYIRQARSNVTFYMEPRENGVAFGFNSDYGQYTSNYESRITTREGTLCFRCGDGGDASKSSLYYYTGSNNYNRKLLTSYDLDNSVSSSSTSMAATSYAVKQAYDKANHSHPYASSSHTHDYQDRIQYSSSYKTHHYYGYTVFDVGGARFRMDEGYNHGGAYKFYPTNAGIDLGSSYSGNTYRWRYIFSQSALNTSDIKSKENIQYLHENNKRFSRSSTPFLDFIRDDFKPATYNYKAAREEEGVTKADYQIGFIANDIIDSEVGKTFLYNFGTEEDTDIMYSPSGYTTVVARALQEEIQKREELEKEVLDLKNEIADLKSIISEIKESIKSS